MEVKTVKDFIASPHMQEAFKRVNAMSRRRKNSSGSKS